MAAKQLSRRSDREVIGLVPAAGQATRIAPLPCSKELFPVGYRPAGPDGSLRPKVAAHYLLEQMRRAGVTKAYVVLRQGKWDIPGYFGDGEMLGMRVAYLMMGSPLGPPYTLDQAFPFVQNSHVAFGFPDVVFETVGVFEQLVRRQSETDADVVLGLFPAPEPCAVDMVDLDRRGGVRAIVIKPARTQLQYTWIVAVWTPAFSLFMHQHLRQAVSGVQASPAEITIGNVLQAAILQGMAVSGVVFPDPSWIDIGRPGDLLKAAQRFAIPPTHTT